VVVTQAPFVRQYPVGAFENGITRADLDRFITSIDAKYRISDSGLIRKSYTAALSPWQKISCARPRGDAYFC
jgi:hypothetical protein